MSWVRLERMEQICRTSAGHAIDVHAAFVQPVHATMAQLAAPYRSRGFQDNRT